MLPDWVIFERFWRQVFVTKVAQICGNFEGCLTNITLLEQIALATYWATFRKLGNFSKIGQLFKITS